MARYKKIKYPERTDFERHLLEGKCLMSKGEYSAAQEYLTEAYCASETDEQAKDVLYHRAYTLLKKRDRLLARDDLKTLQHIAPDDRRTKKLEKMLGRRK